MQKRRNGYDAIPVSGIEMLRTVRIWKAARRGNE